MIERKWNDGWMFWKRGDSFVLASGVPADAKQVTLPHDAMLEEQAHAGSPNGGNTGFRDGGVYVYEKKLSVPADGPASWFLKLEGVYMNALVYVNGELAAHRPYGYTTFYADLRDRLRFGEENTVRVEARNSAMTNSRWYSGSGVYRDVYLLNGGEIYIVPDGLRASTKSVEDGVALVEVTVKARSLSVRARRVKVRVTVTGPDGETAAVTELPLPLPAGTEQVLRQTISVADADLWSAETPALYRVEAELTDGGEALDRSAERFGIRTMTLDPARGLRVNGAPVKLRGACIHHDNGLLGAAEYEEAAFRRVRKLKEAGFNAIRMSHHPMSPPLLRACDALGMYVMDEAFDMWTKAKCDNDYILYYDKWWEEDVEAMVAKDFNHPSVIFYSLGNEILEVGCDYGANLLRQMSEKVKALDPTRYTTAAVNGIFAMGEKMDDVVGEFLKMEDQEDANVNAIMTILDNHMDEVVCHPAVSEALDGCSAAVDTVGYNYMTGRYEKDRDENPHRVIVGSETYPPEIGRNWEVMKRCPNVIGDFTWTGWDYIGEAGIGVPGYEPGEGGMGAQFPCQLAYCGDLDITGFRRPASYYREVVFGLRSDPYITVHDPHHFGETLIKTNWVLNDSVSSWTWPGLEGRPAVAEVYCAAPEVELLVNGRSLGRECAGPEHNFTAYFETAYQPGRITAVAWNGDKELGRTELVTAGEADIRVTAEPVETPEGAAGLRWYDIELVDEHGVVNTAADCEIAVSVENGTLVGLGSGSPRPDRNYLGSETRTWNGRAQAVVMAADGGEPVVTVTKRS